METNEKKKYEKPQVTRIKLDAKVAVLNVCKTSAIFGPGGGGCLNFLGDSCKVDGS